MRAIPLILAVVLTATVAHAQGSISGCIADVSGSRLPGVTVTVLGAESQRQVVTQASGCYSFADLAPGSYAVRAVLVGFCPGNRDKVVVATDSSPVVNFTLSVAALSGPLWLSMPLAYNWQHADAVVYLRVDDILETKGWPAPTCGFIACTGYRATALGVAKRHSEEGPNDGEFTFLQDYVASGEPKYGVGDEFVAFLAWNASWGTFVRSGGPGSMLPVRNGRVVSRQNQDEEFNGIKVEDFLAKLRALAK